MPSHYARIDDRYDFGCVRDDTARERESRLTLAGWHVGSVGAVTDFSD